jgi:hypothetical protein
VPCANNGWYSRRNPAVTARSARDFLNVSDVIETPFYLAIFPSATLF